MEIVDIFTNENFIEKYGKYEFYSMCECLSQKLMIAKAQRQIKGYKMLKKNKKVLFYRKDKENITLDYATVFKIGCDNINDYIKKRC